MGDPRFAKGVTVRGVDPRFGAAAAVKKAKSAAPGPPDSFVAHRCVVLGIDPGSAAGYAIVSPTKSTVFGPDERARVVSYTVHESGAAKPTPEVFERARACAHGLGLPLMIAGEKWHAGSKRDDPTMTPATVAGLGAAWGRWDMCRDIAKIPESRVVRCFPEEWRGRVFGAEGRQRYVKSAEWKRRAKHYVFTLFARTCGSDEAEAICIAIWALHSGRVGEKIPKRKVG